MLLSYKLYEFTLFTTVFFTLHYKMSLPWARPLSPLNCKHTLCTLWFVYTLTLYQIKPTPMVDTSWSGTRLMLWQVGDSFQPTYGRKQARTFSNPPRVGGRTEIFSSIPKLLIIKLNLYVLVGPRTY